MNQILLVIVLYKCALKDSYSYRSLLSRYDALSIFVYDNSPTSQDVDIPNVIYVHDPTNGGLGVAYNKAASYAKEHGFKWLLLLDQDTLFPEDALSRYEEAIISHDDVSMIVPKHRIVDGRYISPTKTFMKTSYPCKTVKSGCVSFKEASPINSGILLTVDSFFKVGGYDPEVTLDFSDVRFVEKYKKRYESFYVMELECLQDFSVNEKDVNKLLGRYLIFLQCAKNCKKERWHDYIAYLGVTLKRTLRLTLQTKNLVFFKLYFKNYLVKK